MILLSFALVVVSATALGFGVFDSSDPLIWISLVAGLGAVALIVGSVLRRRRELVPGVVQDAAGQATAGSVAVGSAPAGFGPAPSPTPSRPSGPSSAARPGPDPVSPPGSWSGASRPRPGGQPGVETWPWATTPPGGSPDPDARPGWTGPVRAVQPPTEPTEPAGSRSAAPAGSADPRSAAAAEAGGPRSAAAAEWPSSATAAPETPSGTAAPETASETGAAEGRSGACEAPPYGTVPAGAPPAQARDGVGRTEAERAAPWDAEGTGDADEPAIERVTVRDALRVAQLADGVVVVDGHPRYHLAGCPTLSGARTMPLAVSVARRGGFTPCAICGPDATLLTRRNNR